MRQPKLKDCRWRAAVAAAGAERAAAARVRSWSLRVIFCIVAGRAAGERLSLAAGRSRPRSLAAAAAAE